MRHGNRLPSSTRGGGCSDYPPSKSRGVPCEVLYSQRATGSEVLRARHGHRHQQPSCPPFMIRSPARVFAKSCAGLAHVPGSDSQMARTSRSCTRWNPVFSGRISQHKNSRVNCLSQASYRPPSPAGKLDRYDNDVERGPIMWGCTSNSGAARRGAFSGRLRYLCVDLVHSRAHVRLESLQQTTELRHVFFRP